MRNIDIKKHLIFTFLIAIAAVSVYQNTFSNGFIYDDYDFIVKNLSIRNLDMESIFSFFTDRDTVSASEDLSKDIWRPFVTASFAVDYKLWRLDPRFYHIENTAYHALNSVILYILMVIVLRNSFAALIASLVFAVHPVQTEAVSWASGRSNVLFLLFFLTAFISHIINRKRSIDSLHYLATLFLFICSLLSKEMAIALPLLMILYDMHYTVRSKPAYYIKYYLAFAVIAISYIFARTSVLGVTAQRDTWWGGSIYCSMLVMLKALAQYIKLLFLPINLNASHLPAIPKSFWDPGVLASVLVLLIIAALYLKFRKYKAVSFFMIWFFVALLPVSNIVPFKAILAERFLYLPMIGYAAIFGVLFSGSEDLFRSKRSLKIASCALFTAVICSYGVMTISRNIEWGTELTFYTVETMREPKNAKPHSNLAYAYSKEAMMSKGAGDISRAYYDLAIKEYESAIRINPLSECPYAGIAYVFMENGRYDLAINNLKKALVLREDPNTYNNLAVSYYNKEMFSEAKSSCLKALALKHDHVKACVNLGNSYFAMKQYRKARKAWEHAVSLGRCDSKVIENIEDLNRMGY